MKIGEAKIDPVKFEQGAWVDNIPEMGDLRLKVRGINNVSWRRLQNTLLAAVPRAKRVGGRIDPDEMDRITATCLRETCLLDWENLENDDGSPLPYSKEVAGKLLTDPATMRFRDAISWAASTVADDDAENVKDVVGN
jgi:hypothetical protein